jgi:predicted nucleotidyltransferase
MSKQLDKTNILNYLKEHYSEFQEKFHVEKIGLFGSYARDNATSSSDIDIVFEVDQNSKFSMFQYLKLNKRLEDAFELKVDLVRESNIKDSLKPYIQKDVIYV